MKKLLLLTTALVAAASPADAGPVAAAVAWVGGILGGSAGAVAAFAMQTALGMGLSLLSQALMPRPKAPGQSVQFDVQMGDELPLSFVVGDYVTAGKRKYLGSWGKNTRFITEVIEVSALPQGLDAVWVNDEPGAFDGTKRAWINAFAPGDITSWQEGETPPGGTYDIGRPLTNLSDDGNRIAIKWLDGTQIAADPFLVRVFGGDADYPWTADMIGAGKSYAIVTTRYDSESLTSYPTYLWQPSPLPMYDLRYDSSNGGSGAQRWADRTTWQPSLNPAVIAYNVARGIYYGTEWVFGGKNLPAWRLPQAEWIAAANACDDTVSLAGGGAQPRYRCGVEIAADMEPLSVMSEIGRAANMKFAEVGGRLKPIVDLPGSAALSITDGDILITEGQSFQPFYPVSDTFNAISATYPERREKWTSKDAPEYIHTSALAEDGRYLPTSVSYGAVPYAQQVQRLMRAQMRDFRRMRRHQFYLPPDAYALEPGIDLISWSSERNGYINKLFMVESVSKTPGMNVLVSLREVDPSDYDWSSDFEMPVVITPPKNPRPFVQPINGLLFTPYIIDGNDGTPRRAAIQVSCNGDETGVTSIQIQARVAGQPVSIDTTRTFGPPHTWLLRDVIGNTAYECRARLLSELTPKSQWSSWISVTTPDVRLRVDEIDQQIIDKLEELEDWIEEGIDPEILDAISEDIAAIDARVTSERDQLQAQVDAVEADVIASLGLARDYTDTAVTNEATTRQSATDALAAQISELTAALVSDDLIRNGDFSAGWDYWTQSGASIVLKSSATTAPVSTMPAAQAVNLNPGSTVTQTTETIEVSAEDRLQVRFSAAAGGTAVRDVEIICAWRDALGATIGSPTTYPISLVAGSVWRVQAARLDPPDTTRSVDIQIRHASASGLRILVTNVEASVVNAAIEARVADLEAAQVSEAAALAIYKSQVTARFGTTEGLITTEAATRAAADTSISNRVTTVEASTASNTGRITATETAIADNDSAIAQLEEEVAATYGAAELIRDPVFSRDFAHWPRGGLGTIATKAAVDGNLATGMPAAKALELPTANGTGWVVRGTRNIPVTPGERLDLSAFYSRASNGVRPRLAIDWLDALGNEFSTANRYRATLSGVVSNAGWPQFAAEVLVPTGAALTRVTVEKDPADTGTTRALITAISLRRRQGFESLTSASITTLTQTQADANGAIAALTTTVAANWSDLDSRATAAATAIDQRYTKTQTDSAIGAAITTLNTDVTNRLGQKANTSAVTALTNRVTAAEGGLSATSTALTEVQARTDRGTGTGRLRVTATSAVSGVSVRLGLQAQVTADATTHTTALFLDANDNGTGGVSVLADQFAVITSNSSGQRYVPFKIVGGVVYINEARIEDLSVGRLKIANQSISVLERTFTSGSVNVNDDGWTNLQTLTYAIGRTGPQHIYVAYDIAGNPGSVRVQLIRVQGATTTVVWQTGIKDYAGVTLFGGECYPVVDTASISGSVTYTLRAARMDATGQFQFTKRYLGALNVYK